jgi:HK97 family phage prohead protease
MKKDLINKREQRIMQSSIELRMEGEGEEEKRTVFGYAAKFNSESQNLGDANYQFYEVIEPGAFDGVLNDDVRALFNHEPDNILARSKDGKGTLRLSVDEIGLRYEFEAPDTQAGRDLMVSLERGDIDQSSFGFSVDKDGQRWEEVRDGDMVIVKRSITKFSRLFDVSPVTYPAYLNSEVSLRNLQEIAEEFINHPDPEPTPEPEMNHFIAHRQRALDLIDKSAV